MDIASGDDEAVRALRRAAVAASRPQGSLASEGRRTAAELHRRAEELERVLESKTKAARQKKRLAELAPLAADLDRSWQSLLDGLRTKSILKRRGAIRLLKDLKELSDLHGSEEDFRCRLENLRGNFKRGTALDLIDEAIAIVGDDDDDAA